MITYLQTKKVRKSLISKGFRILNYQQKTLIGACICLLLNCCESDKLEFIAIFHSWIILAYR